MKYGVPTGTKPPPGAALTACTVVCVAQGFAGTSSKLLHAIVSAIAAAKSHRHAFHFAFARIPLAKLSKPQRACQPFSLASPAETLRSVLAPVTLGIIKPHGLRRS